METVVVDLGVIVVGSVVDVGPLGSVGLAVLFATVYVVDGTTVVVDMVVDVVGVA